MPSLQDLLRSSTVLSLRSWAAPGNMANVKTARKAVIVEFLLLQPDLVPAAVRDQATNLGPASLNATVPSSAPTVLDQASIEAIRLALQPQFDALAERVSTLESVRVTAPTTGELDPTPPGIEPFSIPSFPSSTPPIETARAFFPSLAHSVLESVLANRLDVKDFWKLDPHRQDDVASIPSSSSILDNLSSALFSDGAALLAKAKSRYIDLASILRPWAVYVSVRDIVQPGIGKYLLGHLNELLRLSLHHPRDFPAILVYHLRVASSRINLGDTIDQEIWLRPDPIALSEHFYPFQSATAAARQPSAISSSAPPRPQVPGWSMASKGSLTSSLPCHKWNAREPCAGTKCRFKHVCQDCLMEGHVKGTTGCKGAR